MKKIVLANIWKRAGAQIVDLALTIGIAALLYFPLILPNVLDRAKVASLNAEIKDICMESGLYVESADGGAHSFRSIHSFNKVSELSEATITYQGETTTVHPLDALQEFYTVKASSFGSANLAGDVFQSDILKVGSSESNISSLFENEAGHLAITVVSGKDYAAVNFVLDAIENALTIVNNSPKVSELRNQHDALLRNAALWALVPLTGMHLLVFLLVPLFSPSCQSPGKWLFKLCLVTGKGYQYQKRSMPLRWLSQYLIEFVGAVVSFGATLLITYTMSMFTKNHRSIHDYLGNSVVISEPESLWYLDAVEESEMNEDAAS